MPDIPLCCPIEPHALPKQMRAGLDGIVHRVAASSAAKGNGRDLLLRIYLAGIHHGVELGSRP